MPATNSSPALHNSESPRAAAHRRPSPRFAIAACDVMANAGILPAFPSHCNPGNAASIKYRVPTQCMGTEK